MLDINIAGWALFVFVNYSRINKKNLECLPLFIEANF